MLEALRVVQKTQRKTFFSKSTLHLRLTDFIKPLLIFPNKLSYPHYSFDFHSIYSSKNKEVKIRLKDI